MPNRMLSREGMRREDAPRLLELRRLQSGSDGQVRMVRDMKASLDPVNGACSMGNLRAHSSDGSLLYRVDIDRAPIGEVRDATEGKSESC